jgi:hypothetical protein
MLIAIAQIAAVLATTAFAPVPEPADAVPVASAAMVVNVTAAADISRSLVTAALHEADAVWRLAGFRFIWERNPAMTTTSGLRVVIGGGASKTSDRQLPLAWIGFDKEGAPTSFIYVSHANAVQFMENSRESVGSTDSMPLLQKETYLARAMGRALAHEIGHYLLASRQHAGKGLMTATHSAPEFFMADRSAFAINALERRQMAARFTSIYLASRG